MEDLKNKDVRRILRLRNVQNLLDILLQKGEVARVEISELTGLTKTTITSIVKDLIEKGIIEEKAPVLNKIGIGRSVTPLRIRKNAVHVVGVKLARHHISALLMDAHGDIIYKRDGPSYKDVPPQDIINMLFQVIDDILETNREIDINAIGIGMPGPLDTAKGIVMSPPKFYGWKNVPLASIVGNHYKIPTWIENDANCAALAEKWYGEGKHLDTFLYILLNEGIGGGIIANGKIYKSPISYEVEIGHAVVRYREEVGFLEDFCGFEGVDDPITLKDTERISEIGELIGEVLVSISNIIGPEKVFIGGKMAILGEDILVPIKERFYKYSFGRKIGIDIPIEVSRIFKDAISIGAATHAMRKYIIRKIAGDIP